MKRPKLLHHRLKIAAADPIDELDDADEAPAPSLKKVVAVADPLRLHSFDRLPAPPNRGPSRPSSRPPTRHLRC